MILSDSTKKLIKNLGYIIENEHLGKVTIERTSSGIKNSSGDIYSDKVAVLMHDIAHRLSAIDLMSSKWKLSVSTDVLGITAVIQSVVSLGDSNPDQLTIETHGVEQQSVETIVDNNGRAHLISSIHPSDVEGESKVGTTHCGETFAVADEEVCTPEQWESCWQITGDYETVCDKCKGVIDV